MELIQAPPQNDVAVIAPVIGQSTDRPFIEANTSPCSLDEIKSSHIIPVFIKDNEPLISHADFVETMLEVARDVYAAETVLTPNIRLSHPIKGRIPEARNKPAIALQEHEKTIYYERMMFVIEIPSIQGDIDGSSLSLTLGGVKSYGEDNLYGRKGTDEHFKVFVGFKNRVCTNLCVWSDGFMGNLIVRSLGQLKGSIKTLLESYNHHFHFCQMKRLSLTMITEHQFAQVVGRSRMYTYLPTDRKREIPPLLLVESQINTVCRELFKEYGDGNGINLWRLYNLFTSANKSSYIDSFLERSVNAYGFTEQLRRAIENGDTSWYLS